MCLQCLNLLDSIWALRRVEGSTVMNPTEITSKPLNLQNWPQNHMQRLRTPRTCLRTPRQWLRNPWNGSSFLFVFLVYGILLLKNQPSQKKSFNVFGRPYIIPYQLILNFILSRLTQDKNFHFISPHFIHNIKTISFRKLLFFNLNKWYLGK